MKTIKMFEEFDIVPDKEYLELLDLLDKYDVPREIYGTEGYKTIGHLYNEIKEGETDKIKCEIIWTLILMEEHGSRLPRLLSMVMQVCKSWETGFWVN